MKQTYLKLQQNPKILYLIKLYKYHLPSYNYLKENIYIICRPQFLVQVGAPKLKRRNGKIPKARNHTVTHDRVLLPPLPPSKSGVSPTNIVHQKVSEALLGILALSFLPFRRSSSALGTSSLEVYVIITDFDFSSVVTVV